MRANEVTIIRSEHHFGVSFVSAYGRVHFCCNQTTYPRHSTFLAEGELPIARYTDTSFIANLR